MKASLVLASVLLGFATVAAAQTLTQAPPAQQAVTPAEMDRRLEQQAAATKRIAPRAARIALVDFAWPMSRDEYRAMSRFIVVLVVAVSQQQQELPLKRLYAQAGNRAVALEKFASERRIVPEGEVASMFGRFREDSFWLAPAGAMRKGELLIDFAVNRSGFRVYELPGTPPDFVRADRNPDRARGAKPDARAVRAMIAREYPGFTLPAVR